MALADVVDENSDIEVFDDLLELGVIGLVVAGEVHGENLGLDGWSLGLDLLGEGGELGLGARDEDEVEALVGELKSVLLSDTIGCTGNDGPGTLWTILAKLVDMLALSNHRFELHGTYVCALDSKDLNEHQKPTPELASKPERAHNGKHVPEWLWHIIGKKLAHICGVIKSIAVQTEAQQKVLEGEAQDLVLSNF